MVHLTISMDNLNIWLIIQNQVSKHFLIHLGLNILKRSGYVIYVANVPLFVFSRQARRANVGSGIVSLWLSGTSTVYTHQSAISATKD